MHTVRTSVVNLDPTAPSQSAAPIHSSLRVSAIRQLTSPVTVRERRAGSIVPKQLDQLQPRAASKPAAEAAKNAKKIELSPARAIAKIGRLLRRRLRQAARNARGHARLRKADIYGMIELAYAAVMIWERRGIAREIERLLRRTSIVAIAPRSSFFLVLLRSTLSGLDAKRASKWAATMELADRRKVPRKDFVAFVEGEGGIEGAARTRARLREFKADGWFS